MPYMVITAHERHAGGPLSYQWPGNESIFKMAVERFSRSVADSLVKLRSVLFHKSFNTIVQSRSLR